MTGLMRFPGAVVRDPDIAAWFAGGDPLRDFAEPWFERIRDCGPDVRELLHDHCPTACVGDAAFAYVGAYKSHINVGFFQGASLPDPARLLEGAGLRIRHVKLRGGQPIDEAALEVLIVAAYQDMRARVAEKATA